MDTALTPARTLKKNPLAAWPGKCLTLILGLSLLAGPVQAREQWDVNHGASNPQVDPSFAPGGKYSGFVPKFSGDFWKTGLVGATATKIPQGSVLTAILDDDLSSAKNKPGDTFTLTLNDGYTQNNIEMLPPNTRIIGTVTNVTSARALNYGNPGRMEISLQSLVFPDGRTMPISAFIQINPNAFQKKPPKVRNLGTSIADYGEALTGFATSFVTGPGFMMRRRNRGAEFELEKGEALPVRLTRGLTVSPQQQPAQKLISQPMAAGQPPPFAPSVPGLAPGQVPFNPAPASLPGAPDASAAFNQQFKTQPLNSMPDPF
jgi:hypothetical protein